MHAGCADLLRCSDRKNPAAPTFVAIATVHDAGVRASRVRQGHELTTRNQPDDQPRVARDAGAPPAAAPVVLKLLATRRRPQRGGGNNVVACKAVKAAVVLRHRCRTCVPSGIGESSLYSKDEPPRVHPLFQLSERAASPFPTDIFTVVDAAQATGRRVNLPYPDCAARPSDCEDIAFLNTLDGFGLTTRISIPFDGAIDPATVSDRNVFVISRSSTLAGGEPGGEVIGINQVIWDPATHTLHVEVNEILDQYRQYALIVTDSIHDELGRRIKPSTAFKRFHQDAPADYRARLDDAVAAAETLLGIPEGDIAVASAFTTLSLTPVMERIRDDIKSQTPAPANFVLGPSGERAVYSRASVSSIVLIQQNRVSPQGFINATFPLADLDVVPGAVGTIAQGSYRSPIYVQRPAATIPTVGTLAGVPPVQTYDTIYFTVFVPSGPQPAGGWPVMLTSGAGYRHQGTPALAATWASRGIATIAIAAEGFGFGPLGSLRTNFTDGTSLTIPDAGRSYDQDGNNLIATDEGTNAAGDRLWIVGPNDAHKQTVIDLLQLVRVIEVGMDVDGDGSADIDASRISFHGQSAGGRHGTMLAALDPSVNLVTLSGCCATSPEYLRWNVNQRSSTRPPARRQSPVADQRGRAHLDRRGADRASVLQREQAAKKPPGLGQHGHGRDRDPGGVGDARVGTTDRDEFIDHLAAVPHREAARR